MRNRKKAFGEARDRAPRVIIEIEGGNVTAVFADKTVHFGVIDWDNAKVDEDAMAHAKRLERQITSGQFRDISNQQVF